MVSCQYWSLKSENDCNNDRILHIWREWDMCISRFYNTFHFEKFQIAYFQFNKKPVWMD